MRSLIGLVTTAAAALGGFALFLRTESPILTAFCYSIGGATIAVFFYYAWSIYNFVALLRSMDVADRLRANPSE